MSHPFKVSDKVVAVNDICFDGALPLERGDDVPVIGKVYVVEDICFSADAYHAPLCDLVGMRLTSGCSYEAANFRKLDEVKNMNKESRSEGILHHRRKTQPILVEIMSPQDKTNIVFESARRVNDPLLKGTLWGIRCVEMMQKKGRVE